MHTRIRSKVATATALVALLAGGVGATGSAQAPAPSPGKMSQHMPGMKDKDDMNDKKDKQDKKDGKDKKDMKEMGGMMKGPHHVLAMAYRDNLVTFARGLRSDIARNKTVDLELARPATAEMRRSFEQMRDQHQAQMKMMSDHSDPKMAESMQRMESRFTALREHITALEAEVNTRTPDPKKVSGHTSEILTACAGMSEMHGKDMPHKMK